jgi:NDP-4-keto-2,6-dideoxyhexose 3-C-methyltransferase
MNLGQLSLTGTFPKTPLEKVTTGPIELVKCYGDRGCGLVQLKQSYSLDEMYGLNYGYRSSLNSSMVNHLRDKIQKIIDLNILKNEDLIIDIGSNDGTSLKAYPQNKYKLLGIDPTGIKFKSFYPDSIFLISDFFSSKVISKFSAEKAKIITSFSMFYDLEDPICFAKDIDASLAEDGLWIFEQSYLPQMLKTNAFDTICHEHLLFYSLKQIDWILSKANLKVIDVEFNDINGGSFSVTAAKINSHYQPKTKHLERIRNDELVYGLDSLEVFNNFKLNVDKNCSLLMKFLNEAKLKNKSVYGLGGSTKGNVLLQYCGIDNTLIKAIGDVNEDKYGAYTPGTLIPLLSEEEVLKKNPDYLLILPWHFKDFFLSLSSMRGRTLVFALPQFKIIEL